jgi:hypothetical protein
MWRSLNVPFKDGFKVMEKELEIDPDFVIPQVLYASSDSLQCYFRRPEAYLAEVIGHISK